MKDINLTTRNSK